jgi:hypothetical protein
MTSPTITIFNANPLAVQITVNNGPQFSVAAAGGPLWVPTSPAVNTGPTWSDTTAAQNVLAPGSNYLQITPTGETVPYGIALNLPKNFQWISLQLYVYFNSYSDVSWIVLNNGQYVTGNLSLASTALSAAFAESESETETAS